MNVESLYWRVVASRIYRLVKASSNFSIAKGVVIYGAPIIEAHREARISIGARSVLCSISKFTALGVDKPVILRAPQAGAKITIGEDVGLSGATIYASESVAIGNECLLGANVVICDTDFHPLKPEGRRYSKSDVSCRPVNIGNNVFIGTRSIVLKGVSIGDNSVIGAGSLVSSDIPANVIAAGNPCKPIRHL